MADRVGGRARDDQSARCRVVVDSRPDRERRVSETEVDSRPAAVLMSGELLLGGRDTKAPGGGTAGAVDAPSTTNVPVIATSPHAARTCCILLRVVSVPEPKPAATSPVG